MITVRELKKVLIVVVAAILFVGAAIILLQPTLRQEKERRQILAALPEGSDYSLTEFTYSGEWWPALPVIMLNSRTLTNDEFHRLKAAFEFHFSSDFQNLKHACLFEPHHRLDWKDADGSPRSVLICFKCGDIAVTEQFYIQMPHQWSANLRREVEDLKIPIRTDEEYLLLAQSQAPQ